MSISYSFEVEGNTLKVFASGEDDNYEDVLGYTNAIIEMAQLHQTKKIISDERNLDYKISTLDTFKLAEFASHYVSHVVKIAIVCKPEHLISAKFYETVSQNRGLIILVTTDINEAENWLNE